VTSVEHLTFKDVMFELNSTPPGVKAAFTNAVFKEYFYIISLLI